jgi:hypothetical protein
MGRPRNRECIALHGEDPERDKNGWCKLCRRKYDRARRTAGLHDRGDLPARRKRNKARRRAAVAAYCGARGCRHCGVREELRLHHRDAETKLAEVSALIADTASWKRIWEEIAKCDILCATCRIERYRPGDDTGERSGSPKQRPTTIDKHDPLYTSVALDMLVDGHVSRYNAKRLHARGLTVEDLDHQGFAEVKAAASTMLQQPANGTSC